MVTVNKPASEADTRQRPFEQAANPPPVPNAPARGPPTAVKWVDTDREGGNLQVGYEALDVLRVVPRDVPINVLTILGPARKGKSFLMNALTGYSGVFRVSPAVVPCTVGADLSPLLMSLPDFAQEVGGNAARTPALPAHPTIAFVDMEGQGDKSTEHGVRLATTFLLMSKVVIYNWPGLPNKHTMLTDLVLMIKAAEMVVKDDDGDEAESDHEERATFGHLVILVRDVEGKAAETEDFVLGKERTRGLKHDEKKEVGERNMIRDDLKAAFESITFHTMPSPHPDITGRAVELSEVVPLFTDALDDLRGIIAKQLAIPHTFAGKLVAGGERLHATVVGLCDSVNRTGDICPPSVLVTIDTRLADAEIQKALVQFDNMVGPTLGGDFALTTEETEKSVEGARDSAFKLFDDGTKGISADIAKGRRAELEKQITPKAEVARQVQQERRHALKSRMQAIASRHEAEIIDDAKELRLPLEEQALEVEWNKLVSSRFSMLEQELKKMVTEKTDMEDELVRDDLLKEIGWAISKMDFEDRVKDTHQHIQELNRSKAAGKKDRKAREQAENKVAQLAKQAETFKKEVEVALQEAKKAQEQATEAQARASREAQQAQAQATMMMMSMMGGGGMGGFGGGGGGGMGGGYAGMGAGYAGMGGGYPGGGGGGLAPMKFYAGGQFIPGGGRAPRGGTFMRPNC